jgi:perosamine synthetase
VRKTALGGEPATREGGIRAPRLRPFIWGEVLRYIREVNESATEHHTARNQKVIAAIRGLFSNSGPIPLHAPSFFGNEKKYLAECIDTTFVSYVGPFVARFDEMIAEYTGAKYAISMASGTVALHIALIVTGVKQSDEVITQALTFVATANPIRYCGAQPIFLDSDRETLGMSAAALRSFLEEETEMRVDGHCYNKRTGKRISACIPVHIFGHPCEIDTIQALCESRNIALVEDAAESLGSFYKGRHTGTFGKVGILSYNGNKTITTGGGGSLLTDDEALARHARHLATTAKQAHPWEFFHDMVAYNYRLPNTSAALGCAQMENLTRILESKRALAVEYQSIMSQLDIPVIKEPHHSRSNFWLNAILLESRAQRDEFLAEANKAGVMVRPIWTLLPKLPMYQECQRGELSNAEWFEDRVVNVPSSVRL